MPWDCARRERERGFTLVEALLCVTVLTVGLLTYAGTVVAHQSTERGLHERGLALVTLQRFVERMRADPDPAGLYARLRPLSAETAGDAGLAHLGADASLPTYAATDYYPDFAVPAELGRVGVLVQVPASLREDVVAPRYGLPDDLSGDGVIDADPRDADHRALPAVVRLRWTRPSGESDEAVLATWIRGGS